LDLFGLAGRFFGGLAGLILFAASFKTLGFFIPAVSIPGVAWMLGYRNPTIIVVSTTHVLLAVYLIFIKLLSVNLPGPDHFQGNVRWNTLPLSLRQAP
jgi:putative tricarboxylic transport membrane protein